MLLFRPLNIRSEPEKCRCSQLRKAKKKKIASGLAKLREEDPTFITRPTPKRKNPLFLGARRHADRRYHVETESEIRCFRRSQNTESRLQRNHKKDCYPAGQYKKQSGGHGQYGDVHIRFEPYDGIDLVSEKRYSAVPFRRTSTPQLKRGFVKARKRRACRLSVVGLKATLVDGSYHDVDSSEMSFQTCRRRGIQRGSAESKSGHPLEPIGKLLVHVPDRMMGDIIGDITKRRGQIIGMTPIGDEGYCGDRSGSADG